MRNKYLLLILLLFFPLVAYCGGWTALDTKIEGIHYESSFMIVRVSGGQYSLFDEYDVNGEVVLEDETKKGDRQLSIILAAFMAGKEISFYTDGCKTAWGKKYPKIWALSTKS